MGSYRTPIILFIALFVALFLANLAYAQAPPECEGRWIEVNSSYYVPEEAQSPVCIRVISDINDGEILINENYTGDVYIDLNGHTVRTIGYPYTRPTGWITMENGTILRLIPSPPATTASLDPNPLDIKLRIPNTTVKGGFIWARLDFYTGGYVYDTAICGYLDTPGTATVGFHTGFGDVIANLSRLAYLYPGSSEQTFDHPKKIAIPAPNGRITILEPVEDPYFVFGICPGSYIEINDAQWSTYLAYIALPPVGLEEMNTEVHFIGGSDLTYIYLFFPYSLGVASISRPIETLKIDSPTTKMIDIYSMQDYVLETSIIQENNAKVYLHNIRQIYAVKPITVDVEGVSYHDEIVINGGNPVTIYAKDVDIPSISVWRPTPLTIYQKGKGKFPNLISASSDVYLYDVQPDHIVIVNCSDDAKVYLRGQTDYTKFQSDDENCIVNESNYHAGPPSESCTSWTTISSNTTITEPGCYRLTADVSNLEVNTSGTVVIDANGHSIGVKFSSSVDTAEIYNSNENYQAAITKLIFHIPDSYNALYELPRSGKLIVHDILLAPFSPDSIGIVADEVDMNNVNSFACDAIRPETHSPFRTPVIVANTYKVNNINCNFVFDGSFDTCDNCVVFHPTAFTSNSDLTVNNGYIIAYPSTNLTLYANIGGVTWFTNAYRGKKIGDDLNLVLYLHEYGGNPPVFHILTPCAGDDIRKIRVNGVTSSDMGKIVLHSVSSEHYCASIDPSKFESSCYGPCNVAIELTDSMYLASSGLVDLSKFAGYKGYIMASGETNIILPYEYLNVGAMELTGGKVTFTGEINNFYIANLVGYNDEIHIKDVTVHGNARIDSCSRLTIYLEGNTDPSKWSIRGCTVIDNTTPPCTEINSNYTITEPGCYKVTRDGINVTISVNAADENVELDLNNHTISNINASGTVNINRLLIKNGKFTYLQLSGANVKIKQLEFNSVDGPLHLWYTYIDSLAVDKSRIHLIMLRAYSHSQISITESNITGFVMLNNVKSLTLDSVNVSGFLDATGPIETINIVDSNFTLFTRIITSVEPTISVQNSNIDGRELQLVSSVSEMEPGKAYIIYQLDVGVVPNVHYLDVLKSNEPVVIQDSNVNMVSAATIITYNSTISNSMVSRIAESENSYIGFSTVSVHTIISGQHVNSTINLITGSNVPVVDGDFNGINTEIIADTIELRGWCTQNASGVYLSKLTTSMLFTRGCSSTPNVRIDNTVARYGGLTLSFLTGSIALSLGEVQNATTATVYMYTVGIIYDTDLGDINQIRLTGRSNKDLHLRSVTANSTVEIQCLVPTTIYLEEFTDSSKFTSSDPNCTIIDNTIKPNLHGSTKIVETNSDYAEIPEGNLIHVEVNVCSDDAPANNVNVLLHIHDAYYGVQEYTQTIPHIDANSCQTTTFELNLISSPNTYNMYAVIDPNNEIEETNENDNRTNYAWVNVIRYDPECGTLTTGQYEFTRTKVIQPGDPEPCYIIPQNNKVTIYHLFVEGTNPFYSILDNYGDTLIVSASTKGRLNNMGIMKVYYSFESGDFRPILYNVGEDSTLEIDRGAYVHILMHTGGTVKANGPDAVIHSYYPYDFTGNRTLTFISDPNGVRFVDERYDINLPIYSETPITDGIVGMYVYLNTDPSGGGSTTDAGIIVGNGRKGTIGDLRLHYVLVTGKYGVPTELNIIYAVLNGLLSIDDQPNYGKDNNIYSKVRIYNSEATGLKELSIKRGELYLHNTDVNVPMARFWDAKIYLEGSSLTVGALDKFAEDSYPLVIEANTAEEPITIDIDSIESNDPITLTCTSDSYYPLYIDNTLKNYQNFTLDQSCYIPADTNRNLTVEVTDVPSYVIPDKNYEVTVTVHSTAELAPVDVSVQAILDGIPVSTKTVTVNPGDSNSITFTFHSTPEAGTQMIEFIVDPDNRYWETNENDNTASVEIVVKNPPVSAKTVGAAGGGGIAATKAVYVSTDLGKEKKTAIHIFWKYPYKVKAHLYYYGINGDIRGPEVVTLKPGDNIVSITVKPKKYGVVGKVVVKAGTYKEELNVYARPLASLFPVDERLMKGTAIAIAILFFLNILTRFL